MKKFVCCLLALGLVGTAVLSAGCSKYKTPSDTVDASYEWLDETYTDTSQLSAYPGQNKLDLLAWNVTQTGGNKHYTSSDDIVSREIERVTGITVSDESFDNAGVTADVKYEQLLATGDIPDIAYGNGWVDPDAVYDLTELIDEYCPTIKARMPASVWENSQVTAGQEGKVYGIPYGLGNMSLSTLDPLADPQKTIMFDFQNEYYPYIVVRDDILTAAYPDAKTADEIDALYAKQGYFTEEDLFDVPITSAAQFRTEFLPKIQQVINTAKNEDGSYRYQITADRWVKPMLITEGSDHDTWSFLGVLLPKLLGATGTHANTYFSYWDVNTQKIEMMLTQDFYKNEFYEWAKMIDEGTYVSDERMEAKYDTISSELNSGYYAIGYQSSMLPAGNQAQYTSVNGTTETVRYRKVYLKIPKNEHFEFFGSGAPQVSTVMFFKDSVRESDLPQLLRWLDYQCSRLADKLYSWGPASAGLFEEVTQNGETVRQFKDEKLVDQMVYSTAVMGSEVQKYNLSNGMIPSAQPIFPFVYAAANIYHPKCVYDLSAMDDLVSSYFSSAVVCKEENKEFVGIAKFPSLHYWTESDMSGITSLWAKRKQVEDQLKKLLLAGSSRANFDREYETLEGILDMIGWTKQYFNGAYTNRFLELNEAYLDQFYLG